MWKDTEALRSRWGFIYLHIYLFTCLFISGDPFSEGLIKTVGGKKKFCQGILSMFLRFFHPWKQINSGGKQIVLNRVNFYIFLKYFSGEFPFFLPYFFMGKSEWKKKIQSISFLVRECVFSFLEGSNVCFLWYSFYTTGWNSPLPRGKKFFVFFSKTTERDTDNNLVHQKNSTIAFVQIAKWSIWCKCVTGHKKMWLLNDFSFFTWSNTKKKYHIYLIKMIWKLPATFSW